MKVTQTAGPNLGGQKQKEEGIQPSSRKESSFPWILGNGDIKHNKLKNNNEKEEKYYTNKQTRNTEVQINEQEIGKLP